MASPSILLLGGTGKVARRIAKLFQESSRPVLLASRSGSIPDSLKSSPTVTSCSFDWLDEKTYANIFEQAPNLKFVFLVAPQVQDMLPSMKAFIDLARQKGVQRFVLLSASSLEKGGMAMGKVHEYIVSLRVDYAVLRPTWFMEQLSEQDKRLTVQDKDKIYSATGNGKIPFVSAEDIAAVGYRALTDQVPHNTDHIIVGPELLSYDETAEVLSEVLGRRIQHVKLTQKELQEKFEKVMPLGYAVMLAAMDTAISNGSEERLNDVVLKVTGRSPRTFYDFVVANKQCWIP